MIQIIDHKSCTLPLSCFHLCVPHVFTWLGLSSDTDSLHFALIICAQRQSIPSNVITITDLTHDTMRFRWYLLPQIHHGFHHIYYTSWKVLLNDFKLCLLKSNKSIFGDFSLYQVRKVYPNKAFACTAYAHSESKTVTHVAFFTDVFLAPKCISAR